MTSAPNPTSVYHITHWKHLPSILQCGGLCCYTMIQERNIAYTSIAQSRIQARRGRRNVPIAPFGTLHDYVPFYFSPRSPMLGSIQQGKVEEYTEGQEPIIHLVSMVQTIASASVAFVFTEGHAVMPFSEYFSDVTDLDKVDWEFVDSWRWGATEEDPDRTRRKQSEFLVHQFLPWALITEIGVYSNRTAAQVNKVLTATTSPLGQTHLKM